MNLINRPYPYPVLSDLSTDYSGVAFQATHEIAYRPDELVVSSTLNLSDREIQMLVKNRKAHYLVHAECPLTRMRKAVTTSEPFVEFSIPKDSVSAVLELTAAVVVAEPIDAYESKYFAEYLKNFTFSLQKGEFLAIAETERHSIARSDDPAAGTSIIQIERNPNPQSHSTGLNLSKQSIVIELSPDRYEQYEALVKMSNGRRTLVGTLALPALTIALTELVKEESDYDSTRWYRSLKQLCDHRDITLDDQTDLLALANELLSDTVGDLWNREFAPEEDWEVDG